MLSTNHCLCGQLTFDRCDRCGNDGPHREHSLQCPVHGKRKGAHCVHCAQQGWTYESAGKGRWVNRRPDMQPTIHREATQLLHELCESYEGDSDEQFIERMASVVKRCKQMGFY